MYWGLCKAVKRVQDLCNLNWMKKIKHYVNRSEKKGRTLGYDIMFFDLNRSSLPQMARFYFPSLMTFIAWL